MNVLDAVGITKVYTRGHEAINALGGVSLSVNPGEFIAITGPSGAGKTALLHILGCLDTPTGGFLLVNGKRVTGKTERDLVKVRRKTFGFIFQQFFLIPTLTARENICLPLIFSHQTIDDHAINIILEQVGLATRASHYPHELSGGEMQRVAIGRALATRPTILLADEPTGNLDTRTSESIVDLFRNLNDDGLTIVMVTHNPTLAARAGRIISVRDGLIVDS